MVRYDDKSEPRNETESHSRETDLEPGLDHALKEAFGRAHVSVAQQTGVVGALQETMGIHPRVLLRDVPEEPTPVTVGRSPSPSVHEPLASGADLGRYQVAGELARGGVGIVMKGRDPDLGREVAIKILRDEFHQRAGMVARFVEEAQIAAQLQHPGIPPVYELGLAARKPYFSMKLIKGRTLAVLLRERKRSVDDRQRLISVFEQVCQAVAYAHARAVIHRDLKPSNIMVGAFGEVQVVDWGLAKVLPYGGLADEAKHHSGEGADEQVATVRSGSSAALSMVGSVLGTPAYMPPEQARGEVDRLDERSDVFSLGAILCEILTGHPPFAGRREEALESARTGRLDAAFDELKASGAGEELIAIAQRCLSPDPADRPCHAGEVAEQIAAYLSSLADRARSSELAAARAAAVAQQERRARRLTVALGSVIVIAVVLILAGVMFVQQKDRAREARRVEALNAAVYDAANLLGQATAARVGRNEPWIEADAAFDEIRDILEAGGIQDDARDRAEQLLLQYEDAARDRRLIEKLEEVVIIGATHNDKHSWLWMEEALRQAFRDYGIDLLEMPQEKVAARIRESDLAAQLTDCLELWMGTCGHLYSFGVVKYPPQELMTWIEVLYEADPDPFAGNVRRLVYSRMPDMKAVKELVDTVDFAEVRPRTLAWLASAAYRTGDIELVKEIFRRALLLYPDDLMLNFDFAYNMMVAKDYHRAIRAYERCLAIRPQTAGIWRGLGVALRHVEQYEDSTGALLQSIHFQPDHAPTYVDLGMTWEERGRIDKARDSYEQALAINPDLSDAQTKLEALDASNTGEGE